MSCISHAVFRALGIFLLVAGASAQLHARVTAKIPEVAAPPGGQCIMGTVEETNWVVSHLKGAMCLGHRLLGLTASVQFQH